MEIGKRLGQIIFSQRTETIVFQKETELSSQTPLPEAYSKAFQTDPDITIPEKESTKKVVSFRIGATVGNFAQYVRTIKAFIAARLPFRYIANAGTFLKDQVETKEAIASIRNGWQNKAAEIAENPSQVIAWQDRGEEIMVTNQLPSGVSGKQGKIIAIVPYLANSENTGQKIGVIEGIGVNSTQPSQLPNSAQSDNPYLQAPAKLEKAA